MSIMKTNKTNRINRYKKLIQITNSYITKMQVKMTQKCRQNKRQFIQISQ